MSDDGSAPAYETSASMPNNYGTTPLALDVHGDKHDPASPTYDSKERDFTDRLSRQPSFLEHLADSRDSQFPVQNRGEIERYFVCENLQRATISSRLMTRFGT